MRGSTAGPLAMRAAFFMSTVETFQHIWWEDRSLSGDAGGAVCLLDQRLLPAQEVIARCTTLADVARAITTMQVRGAPAIGCTAAYGMALVAHQSTAATTTRLLAELAAAKAL